MPLTALLRPGDEVLTTDALYGPTRRFLTRHMKARGVQTAFHPAEATTDATSTRTATAAVGSNNRGRVRALTGADGKGTGD